MSYRKSIEQQNLHNFISFPIFTCRVNDHIMSLQRDLRISGVSYPLKSDFSHIVECVSTFFLKQCWVQNIGEKDRESLRFVELSCASAPQQWSVEPCESKKEEFDING